MSKLIYINRWRLWRIVTENIAGTKEKEKHFCNKWEDFFHVKFLWIFNVFVHFGDWPFENN